jgi:hypothetical protein
MSLDSQAEINAFWLSEGSKKKPTQLERYQPISLDALREEQDHKERMAQEESYARQYMAKLVSYGIIEN